MCQVFAGQDPARYTSTTRRLRINGQSTSIRLENAEGVSTPCFLSKLHAEVLELRGEPENFTSLLRTTCLIHLAKSGPGADLLVAAE